jgi:DNA polymerase-3 subunit delta
MQNKQFQKELEKGLPHSLYFLWSKEVFLLDEALEKVSGTACSFPQRDFNYDTFTPSSPPQAILDAALSFPFMSPRRLVVLKDFHQFPASHIKTLQSYFREPSHTTCMVILSQKEPQARIDANWRIYRFNIRERDIPIWIRQRASSRGISITESAVDYLIEALGPDIGLLATEIEKLSLSGLKKIDDGDILAHTGMLREYTPFNLIDAITAGQKTKAFRILRSLIEKKSSDATAVLGPLNWHYRQLYAMWENKGKRPLKMKSSTHAALLQKLPFFTQENFYEIFQCLHEADKGIKTSGRPELVLEVLLIKLLQIGTGN